MLQQWLSDIYAQLTEATSFPLNQIHSVLTAHISFSPLQPANFLALSDGDVPVIGEQAVAEHEPAALVALQVVGPFKEPAFAGVHARQVEPRQRRGRQTLDQLVHLPPGARFPGGAVEAVAGSRCTFNSCTFG